jgi:probable F420-dependent oxidoreductase
VLEADESTARSIARQGVSIYLGLPNYTNNLVRLGTITEDDLADGGSDRLVDAIVAWGDDAAIRRRLDEHLAAGADHVCVQVLTADPKELPTAQWQRLAEVVA